MKLCTKITRKRLTILTILTILTQAERPLNISVSLPMPFAVANVHRAEGQFRRFKSKLNKLKSLKFQFGTRRPTVSKRAGKYSEPFKNIR
jgi:hypothetical protein